MGYGDFWLIFVNLLAQYWPFSHLSTFQMYLHACINWVFEIFNYFQSRTANNRINFMLLGSRKLFDDEWVIFLCLRAPSLINWSITKTYKNDASIPTALFRSQCPAPCLSCMILENWHRCPTLICCLEKINKKRGRYTYRDTASLVGTWPVFEWLLADRLLLVWVVVTDTSFLLILIRPLSYSRSFSRCRHTGVEWMSGFDVISRSASPLSRPGWDRLCQDLLHLCLRGICPCTVRTRSCCEKKGLEEYSFFYLCFVQYIPIRLLEMAEKGWVPFFVEIIKKALY